MPRAGEQRIAFVFATQTDIFSSPQSMSEGGVVLEVVTPGYGGRGYPFAITTRPSALAIYAIAGVEDILVRGGLRRTSWASRGACSVRLGPASPTCSCP